MKRLLVALAATLILAVPAYGQGWRPDLPAELSDAAWLTRLDARLAPVHGTLLDTLSLVDGGSPNERDAYVTVLQEQAIKGIRVLDEAGSPPLCAVDYIAAERTMFLAFGDSADAFRQMVGGSSQAGAELSSLVPIATYILNVYGDRLRLGICETVEPVASTSPLSTPGPARTTSPARTATPTG